VKAFGRYLAGALLALLASTVALHGDERAASKESPMHDELGRLVGSWDASVTFVLGGKENQGKARCEAKWILDGHTVQQEYNSNFMGRPLTILQLLTYDADKKKLVEIHMTNLHGGALCNQGESLNGGKEWKLNGPYLDPQTRKMAELRTVYTFEDSDHFTLDWFTPGADGKEVRSVHIAHSRRN
jgi:Protein of unknown function (DUF1579)